MSEGLNSKAARLSAGRSVSLVMACPNCGLELNSAATQRGLVFFCPRCKGFAATNIVLGKMLGDAFVRDLASQTNGNNLEGGKDCPECGRAMCNCESTLAGTDVRYYACQRCRIAWFDSSEIDGLSILPRPQVPKPSISAAQETVAATRLRIDGPPEQPSIGGGYPEEAWQWIPALLGFPVKMDSQVVRLTPYVTWGLGALLALIFLVTRSNIEHFVSEFGLLPGDPFRHGGLTLLTSFLLHGGFIHLISNVYILLIFGSDVEDSLGHWRYILLILLAAFASSWAYVFLEPRMNMPCIGASGGIAAIIVYYVLTYPKARIGFLIMFRYLYTPAWLMFFFWIIMQFIVVKRQLAGMGHVSGLSHLGGVAFGVVAWLLKQTWKNEKESHIE
jgi:membrane associated rhomboid family serine protease/Zn-finger nucleic acid-binding protein